MNKVSIVVPLYNGATYIASTLQSLLGQTHSALEIIVVDDASTDDSCIIVSNICAQDSRVVLVADGINRGTHGARKRGVELSSGDFVTFVDQDDELVPHALERVLAIAQQIPADIYHFGVEVIPENTAAKQAAEGMLSFLTPSPRILIGDDILTFQLSQNNGFDWHVHHKIYQGDFVRQAYRMSTDKRLVQADDFYMCYIMAAIAQRYYALADAPYYRYHLGRGDTFGAQQTPEHVLSISSNNATALHLIESFISRVQEEGLLSRTDWTERLMDAQRCLVEYPMNEWMDNLSGKDQQAVLSTLLHEWEAEFIGANLWRFSRDTAYAYLVENRQQNNLKTQELEILKERACFYRDLALQSEREYNMKMSTYTYYQDMRAVAINHLHSTGLFPISLSDKVASLFSMFRTKLRMIFSAD